MAMLGTGKTHLATAIGVEACKKGYNVKFFRTAALVNRLVEARKEWVNIFYDEQMTAAIIDRLIPHCYLLIFDGQSYRMKQSLMKQLS
ncbi:IstB-like ATP binding protein [Caldanaerobacter subterraneus]|uniref:IstB-like ATP binding protein n=1 Tax=Caldanaerobacter subterraneus TaxID=911092 RepID=A0A4R2J9C1_9THEO|nr:ATP-binding protein [Caldanaerobacter subterraneus]TCO55324.1 IstB-like ATP binding protein [Caldanaerobacter subterraneus]